MIGLLLLQAVNALKKCKDKVVLLVAKAEIAYTSSPTMGQIPPLSAGHFSLPNRYEVHKSLREEDVQCPILLAAAYPKDAENSAT